MKTFLKILLVLVLLFLLSVGGGFFALMRPEVQKSLIEGRLPEGSTLAKVQITPGSIELFGLELRLADGTSVVVGRFQTEFEPLAAIFGGTVRVGDIEVDGLRVDLPNPIVASVEERSLSIDATVADGRNVVRESRPSVKSPEKPVSDSFAALYQLEGIEWLFEIGSIQLDGEVRDSVGSQFKLDLSADEFKPGEKTRIRVDLELDSAREFQGGLKEFAASASLELDQLKAGGFSRFEISTNAEAEDSRGRSLLSFSQELLLDWDAESQRTEFELGLSADLPRPSIFTSELEPIVDLGVDVSFRVVSDGAQLMVEKTELSVRSGGRELVEAQLKQPFDWYGVPDFQGDLVEFRLFELPLSWLQPWMPEGMVLRGEPISLALSLRGVRGGGFELSETAPLVLGPLSLYQDEAAILLDTSLSFSPRVFLNKDNIFEWELSTIKVQDRYGSLFEARSVGGLDLNAPQTGFIPDGLYTETEMNLGLLELSQQPFLQGKLSLLTGRVRASVTISEESPNQVSVDAVLAGLSARDSSGLRQDYHLGLQARENESGALDVSTRLRVGSDASPSTLLETDASIKALESVPLRFDIGVEGEVLTQSDLDLFIAAFSSSDGQGREISGRGLEQQKQAETSTSEVILASVPVAPPWSALDGIVSVKLDQLITSAGPVVERISTQVAVTKPLLDIDSRGEIAGATFQGSSQIRYSESGYDLGGRLALEGFDPAELFHNPSRRFPFQGTFEGEAELSGAGISLGKAFGSAKGFLRVSGEDGVLTAFELEGLRQAGLISAAGLIGRITKQPGIAAMAGAVPYLQSIRYDEIAIELARDDESRILIPELALVGESVLIDGSGWIGAESLSAFFTEPLIQQLSIELKMGAKGRLGGYLDDLGLLRGVATAGGYRLLNRDLSIGGTLGEPDTSILNKILNEAARRVLSGHRSESIGHKSDSAPAAADPQERGSAQSKEEQLIRDVETGVQLLNSLFGN